MSKITSKNLHYDAAPPPFLARLKAGHASQDGRREHDVARPRKERTREEEEEDEPVVFDEGTGETLTRSEWEGREKAGEEREVGSDREGGHGDGIESNIGQERARLGMDSVAGIGIGKKRKVGKIVGSEEGESEASVKPVKAKNNKTVKGEGTKKLKKVKLSFGDH